MEQIRISHGNQMDRKPLILIADDDRGTRHLIRRAMENHGFDVLEAENGQEVLDAFDSVCPAIVFLDVHMPLMDGFEACRKIRAHPEGISIPIVIITVRDDIDAISKAYNAGATDFITKPINRIILSERVRYMLRADATARQLQRSQELLTRAQSIARLGSFHYDTNTSYIDASDEFKRIFGLSKGSTLSWNSFWQKIDINDREKLKLHLQNAQENGVCFQCDLQLVNGDERYRYIMLQVDPELNNQGKVERIVGIVQDITERKRSELLEINQNKILKHIARRESLKDILTEVVRLMESQHPQSVCAVCKIENKQIDYMIAPSLPSEFEESMAGTTLSAGNGTCAAAVCLGQPAVAEEICASPYWKKCREAAYAAGLRSSASVPAFSGNGQILGTVAMMHRKNYCTTTAEIEFMERVASLVALALEQHHLSERLIYQANHDHLTGLLNRQAMAHWLSKILRQSIRVPSPVAYLLIDLDRFKRINDLFGHHVGDLLLQEIATRLQQCIRESDVLSRIGGDEFVLVMPSLQDNSDPVRVVSRMLDALNPPFTIEGHSLFIKASIGITLFPQDASDALSLHKNADLAMYIAKNKGGNEFHFFDRKMQEGVIQRLQIENDLRKAFERKEFELYYQPQLNLTTNELIVFEALIRWNHPERGLIMADRFIDVAEESRLIIPIGQWVLKEACRQNMDWQKQGFPPVRVAVNVSAVQFTERDFVKRVQEALEETGLDSCWLELELTETALIKDMEKASENLKRLKSLGVTTTLDDFGTGYSSVAYLRHIPLDGIKIDQSFLRDIVVAPVLGESRNTNFMKAFVDLAQNLRLNLVAEGIETEHQSKLLKNLGYTIGQGFLFSVPLPASEAGILLAGDEVAMFAVD